MIRTRNDECGSQLAGFAETKGVTRRDFLSRAVALGLTIPAANTIWANRSEAKTPKHGGFFKAAVSGGATTDTLNPQQTIATTHHVQTAYCAYETLVQMRADGTAQSSLSTEWETPDGALTWNFKLRKDARFLDGSRVRPEDVIYSFRHVSDENATYAEGKSIMSGVEEMKVDGPNSITFILKSKNADFPVSLAAPGMIIGPEGTKGQDWNRGLGSGAYTIENYEPGVRSQLKRRSETSIAGEAFFDEIELINAANETARINALMSGEVHAITNPDTRTAKRLNAVEGLKLLQVKGGQHYTTAMRVDQSPFRDNNVRLAVKHALDRQEIVEKILSGFGTVGNDIPYGLGFRFYNDELPQRSYDPDKSKYYLRQAGLDRVSATLHASGAAFAGAVDAGSLIAETSRPAGIDVTVKREPDDGYWSNVWLQAPWCFVYWNSRPTIDWHFGLAYKSDASWNDTGFKSERIDMLIDTAKAVTDEKQRQEMYFEAQKIIYDEGGTTVLAFADYLHGVSDKIGLPERVSGLGEFDGIRAALRWWFK